MAQGSSALLPKLEDASMLGLGAGAGLLGMGWPQAELQPPTPPPTWPRVVTLHDRQVYVPNEDASLYSLIRKWVQNFPVADTPQPEQQAIPLGPLPKAEPQPQEPKQPTYEDEYNPKNYEPRVVFQGMKTHWVKIRQLKQQEAAQRMQRQQTRLVPWLQVAPLPANALSGFGPMPRTGENR